MNRILMSIAFAVFAFVGVASAQNVFESTHYGWTSVQPGPGTAYTRRNSTTQYFSTTEVQCTGGIVTRTYTMGGLLGVTTGNFYIHGAAIWLKDSAVTAVGDAPDGAMMSIQLDKNYQFIIANVLPQGSTRNYEQVVYPGDKVILVAHDDVLLEESSCKAGVSRSAGINIYYSVAP